jgi:hypothetical protein
MSQQQQLTEWVRQGKELLEPETYKNFVTMLLEDILGEKIEVFPEAGPNKPPQGPRKGVRGRPRGPSGLPYGGVWKNPLLAALAARPWCRAGEAIEAVRTIHLHATEAGLRSALHRMVADGMIARRGQHPNCEYALTTAENNETEEVE